MREHLDFFSRLLWINTRAKLRHLYPSNPGKLGSGWEHSVLGSYYSDLEDLTDKLIECYQGIYGLHEIIVPEAECEQSAEQMISSFYTYVEVKRTAFKESFIQNIIDEIQALNSRTIYKLKYLK
jgi:hypothetical protein